MDPICIIGNGNSSALCLITSSYGLERLCVSMKQRGKKETKIKAAGSEEARKRIAPLSSLEKAG
jgi:hypothetical protein